MGKKEFEVILGTYEEFLLGFQYNKKVDELAQTFATHSHSASIRSVAFCDGLLASGGADDRISVYDLKTRKEHCMLTHHNGTVNCLQFTTGRTHLISGSQDGALAVIRVGNWQLEKLWEGAHKGSAIIDIALHSSGKLALSLGADCTLRTWNLIKGRQAYVINLNSKCKDAHNLHTIRWAPDGVRFLLAGGKTTDIWSIETGGIVKSITHNLKVTSCVWLSNEKLIVGFEEGEFSILEVESGEMETYKAHNTRVKCLSICNNRLITASSDGEIKIWNMKFQEVNSINAGCRITCMCISDPPKVKDEEETNEDADVDDVQFIDNEINVKEERDVERRNRKTNKKVRVDYQNGNASSSKINKKRKIVKEENTKNDKCEITVDIKSEQQNESKVSSAKKTKKKRLKT